MTDATPPVKTEEKPMNKAVAWLGMASTVIGAIAAIAWWPLTLIAGAAGVFAASRTPEPMQTIKSFFSKVGGFYASAWKSMRGDMKDAAEWAEKHEAERTSSVAEVASKPDFDKAAAANDVKKAPNFILKEEPKKKTGLGG